ncbi:fap1 adhesin [Halyomorpha halys]|uniref:fap1 adhesin n=1 Tax=Halyomorpha halys TaxID=286706 RepID=UPI0006D4FBAB|nr:uncharacterized protein LOC106685277 [Halyomorpha halys]
MSVLNKVNVISSIGYDCKICHKLSHERQETIAGVFSTYAHSWLTSGPDLFVVNNSDGVLQSYWTFGENLQDDLEITCAVELPLEGCAIPILILGVSSENVNLVCFFNPNTRKILRTIDIIYPVRTICVIEDGTNEVYPLNDSLTPTEGLIAVGCAEGTVLLIDLCRSILCKAVNGDFRFYSTEENPSEVVYFGVNSVASGGLSQKIVESRKKKNCVSVILTDPSDEGITALLYSIESAVLFVGTSSGSFHLWNMSSLSCLFKSPGTNRAIISLSLLEPCDDPRHSLYLWICFEEYAQVAMYCISFSSKFFVPGYGVYYQNFESAGLVYRFILGMEVDMLAKRPICSQAIAKLVPKNLVRCISLPEAEGTHLRLFITAYEIVDKGQISIRAVIFDLNQWYRDQMPDEGISACLDSIDLDSKNLWHLQLDPSSLTLYQCVRPQEQHFHPTAFDFQIWCIEEEGVRCLEKLGLQTQWLRNMSRMGSKALIEPTQIFLGALAAGLLPSFVDPPDPEANNEVEERFYVLTICLENRIIKVIEDCVKDWNSGGYTVRGCTIQFLLDWLWSLHRTYKANGNKICIPLFDQSGMKFDVSEKRSLQHCKSLLNTVQSVYTNIVNRYKNTVIISGIEEKLTAMSLVRLYFDCCLKLISVNLLPEPNDLGKPSDSVVYHFDDINAYAINRRKEGPFLGDSLLGRTDAEKQWLEEGGTGLYPPPSIQSVLRFCLHPSPSIANKMSLLLYLFMDIINCYTPIRSQPVLDRIKNFQHLMRIPEVQYKIVAGCWYLDHSMFDEGVDLLFDPRVLCVDLSEDQHRGILHLLASEGQEKLALQYLRLKSPTLNLANDLRVELNLLLSNSLVNEAFLFQRKHPEMRETLLIEFFEGCIERKQLGQVFGLNLDFKEEATLMKYLKSSGLKEKGDLQVLLLLSKAKYTEAMFLNDKLNSSINGPKSRIETDTRDMIVRGITGSLNTISRHIANEMKTYRPPPAGSYPQPLSSLIKVRNGPDGPLCQTDSKVLLSAVAKSTRHLSDFVNSFESGQRRKREENDTDVEFENEPSRKRLKLLDTASNKVPSLSGKWLTSPSKPTASQKRDVMELVGTPLVKKRGKRFSPQSRPSSILKGKTPEKGIIITEDFGETPKKTLRFALPENEIQITARKPLRENETTISSKYTKMIVDNQDEPAIPVTEELPKPPCGLGKPSARKPLHGNDSLNTSMPSHDPSVIENIKDRLRSSAKKKVLEDGVNWHQIAEASKPRVLFTQGVSKITSITKSDRTPSSTPMSQVLLDITVTSAEKKYLDSPSRGEETSPITEALFNTTLLPKVLFSSGNNEKEMNEKFPEEVSTHSAFLDRYKQLRNKNIKSNNAIINSQLEEAIFDEEQSVNVICTKKTVEVFKSSETSLSDKIGIDEYISSKKELFDENTIKQNDELDKQSEDRKNILELISDKEELNNESLVEEQEVQSNDIQNEILLGENEHTLVNDELYPDVENSLPENNPLLKDDISPHKNEDEIVSDNQEKVTEWSSLKLVEVKGNCFFGEHIDNSHDISESLNEKETEEEICEKEEISEKEEMNENEEISEKEEMSEKVEMSEKEELEDEEKLSKKEEMGDNEELSEKEEYEGMKEICPDIISKDKTCLSKSRPIKVLLSKKSNSKNKKDTTNSLNDNEMLKGEVEVPNDCQFNITNTLGKDKPKEVSPDSIIDCEQIIDIVSDDDEYENEDKQSFDESLTDEETEGISGESSEEIEEEEEEMSEKEENGSDSEGSLPEVSSISSDGDDAENSDESRDFRVGVSVHRRRVKPTGKKIKKNANVCSKKEQPGESPILVLSDDSGDETSKNKKESSGKKVSNAESRESKTKTSSQCEEHYEDVSDSEVFGLKNDKSDNNEEENAEDDMWIGLDDKESTNINKSEDHESKDYDLYKTESSQKRILEHNIGSHQKEPEGYEKDKLKPFNSSKYSKKKSLSGSNHSKIVKEDVENNVLNNTSLGTSEISVLNEGTDCDVLPIISNAVCDPLSEQELIEDSPSVNISGEILSTTNKEVDDGLSVKGPVIEAVSSIPVEDPVIETVSSFLIEGPVIESVSSFSVEDPVIESVSSFSVENPVIETISEQEMLAEESQPVSLPSRAEVSSLNNEDSCNEKIVENAEGDSKEDFQSIERNWTQQIEEEMKQDSVIFKIEAEHNDSIDISSQRLLNFDGSNIVSKEPSDPKSIEKSECQQFKNSEVVSSLQTFLVEHTQNDVLKSEESKNLPRSKEIDGKDFSINGTTNLSIKGDDLLPKDKISHFNKPVCVLSESGKKYEGDVSVIATGTGTKIVEENIVSYKDSESAKDDTNKVSVEALKNQSIIILKESDNDEQNKEKTSLYDNEKPNQDFDNPKVLCLNAPVDDDSTREEDCHGTISEDNNGPKISLTVLPSQGSFTKHSDNNFKIVDEKNCSLEASSTNILSDLTSNVDQSVLCKLKENIMSIKNESSTTEKCKLPGNNFSEVNLISVKAKTNKLAETADEFSANSLDSPSEKCASITSIQDNSQISLEVYTNDIVQSGSISPTSNSNILIGAKVAKHEEDQQNRSVSAETVKNESENITDCIEIHEKDNSKKDNIDETNKFVVTDTIIPFQDKLVKASSEISEITTEFEVQPTSLPTASEHLEESMEAKTFQDRIRERGKRDSGSCTEVGDLKVVCNINEISVQVKNENVDINSAEVICETINDMVPNISPEKIESSKLEDSTQSEQKDNHGKIKTGDQVFINSAKDSDAVGNQKVVIESSVKVIDSANVVSSFEVDANNILNEQYSTDKETVSKVSTAACESNAHKDEKVVEENISLSVENDICPDMEPLDAELNNAKINDLNNSSASDALNPLKKEIIYKEQNVKGGENSEICYEKTSIEKSFFFGKEDIETYIRSTKATFQIGGRLSLPEEDEPVDPMEVAMIEDEEKVVMQPSPTEPDIDLSLHLSPEHLRKPKKVDQETVTENSYLQRRARKLRKSVKKLLTDESDNKESDNKIIFSSEDHVSNILRVDKELKCMSTQTSDGALYNPSDSEEELIDHTNTSGTSQKPLELEKKITRKMRQSSEPPLTHKEDLKRKSSICPQKNSDELKYEKEEPYRDKKHSQRLLREGDIKGILKNKDLIEKFDDELKMRSKADNLPVRRSRRLSESITDTNELLGNQHEKNKLIKSQRRSRGYSEEPDLNRISSYKDRVSAGNNVLENEKEAPGKDILKQRRSRRHSEETETQAVHSKNEEKEKVESASTNIGDEYTSRKRSKRFSEESESAYKHPDERRRNSKNSGYSNYDSSDFKHTEESEIRGILKNSSKGSRKTSLSSEMINEMKHYQETDSYQESRQLRSQSEEPELQGIPKKRYRPSRRSSYTHETAVDFHSQVEEIPMDNRKIQRQSEDVEIQGILKKRSSNKSRISLSSEVASETKMCPTVDQSEGSTEFRKQSEGEIQGILKKSQKDVLSERNSRSRRHSEEPEMLNTKKRRERSSQSSDIDNEFDLQEDIRQIRRHSEEPEVKRIYKNKRSRRSSYTTETTDDLKNENSKEQSEKSSDVIGILKKIKISRRSSNAGEIDKEGLEKKRSDISRKNDLINCAKIQGDYNYEKSNSDVMKMVTDTDIDSSSSQLVSENRRSRQFKHVSNEEEAPVKESPAKVRRRSSTTARATDEPVDVISLPEGEIRNLRKSNRKTPDRKEINDKKVEEKKGKSEPEPFKFVPKRLEYSDYESPEKKKSRSLIDFPIKRNSRLPRPALEDIREEDEDLLKKKKKSMDDFHLEEMKKKTISKKPSLAKLVVVDSDGDSDVSTPELWKKDSTKEKRLTRTQQKLFLMNQQLTSVSEVISPSTSSSPRRSIRKKPDAADSPLKTPTRSSLRLQKKPPSEID